MGGNYKPSEFNVIHAMPEGGAVVVNTFSRSVSELDARELRELRSGNIDEFSDGEREELAKSGLIIPRDVDEVALLSEGLRRSKRDRTHATITVLTTLACNFECPYCFQSHTSGIMSAEVQDLVVDHIGTVASRLLPPCGDDGEYKESELTLCVTGGEPLLALPAIRRLVTGAREACSARGVRLVASMITNGYLLDREVAEELSKLSPNWTVQITLDGARDTHDGRRRLRGGGRTYDRIVQNILSLDSDVFTVKLRINVDRDNLNEIDEVYNWAEGLPNVIPYVAPVTAEETQDERTRCACFLPSEYREFYGAVDSAGLISDSISSLLQRGTTCAAAHELSCCVDANGFLYKCFDKTGQIEYAYAKLGNPDFSKPEREEPFLSRSVTAERECKDCKFLPQCLGGCPLAWLERGTHYCAPAKFLIGGAVERMRSGQ